jgi:threonylcarbamoyladenosine tRNA methylthiotransferase MtaB
VPQKDKCAFLKAVDLASDAPVPDANIDATIRRFEGRTRAFLRMQDGCSRRCSFCAVPLARGRSVSKDPDLVLAEARALCDHGCPEIVLCGVDLGKYGTDLSPRVTLPDVLERLLRRAAPTRFRISSIDVTDVTRRLLSLMASSDRVCPHLHLPLQSGDAGILRAMRRGYTPDLFLDRVRAVRDALDRPAITTDCMVGFPGETDECFERTLAVVRAAAFTRLHVFRFSPRPGTEAHALPGRLPERVLSDRARLLIDAGLTLAAQYRSALLAGPESGSPRTLDVVIERAGDTRSSGLAGRYVRVVFPTRIASGTRLAAVPASLDGTDLLAGPA